MGNERSQPSGLVIEEKALQADNFWTLHSAAYGGENGQGRKVTVFVGGTESSKKPTALEKFAQNLKIYRHPSILKYVASWKVNGQYHLATEEVFPLTQIVSKQTTLQICIGLHSLLKALMFLHEKAEASHNNVCQAAIYVSPEGHWRLGGMEYLCRFSDLSAGFLTESRIGRYVRAVSPDESTRVPQPCSAIDLYAFGILAEEVLSHRENADEVPGLEEFLDICKVRLQSRDCSKRPPFSQLLELEFFSHPFITIHNFLTELPLKSDSEKQLFFRDLSSKLKDFNETVVACQLGSLLLSRMVVLDLTAQQYLLPYVLVPRTEQSPDSHFSEKTFKQHMVPKLMSIFCVRDVQVRLILLTYFKSFISLFSQVQLHSHILPELLVGIKDTNDQLVGDTLRALAELVPVLGSASVIGGKRMKHFSDGRPKAHRQLKSSSTKRSIKTVKSDIEPGHTAEDNNVFLAERPSPDGGEAPSPVIPEGDDDDEDNVEHDDVEVWESWENPSTSLTNMTSLDLPISTTDLLSDPVPDTSAFTQPISTNSSTSTSTSFTKQTIFPDLEQLDLKTINLSSVSRKSSNSVVSEKEVDFFSDMEPVISKTTTLVVNSNSLINGASSQSAFSFDINLNDDAPDGWGDDVNWAEVNEDD